MNQVTMIGNLTKDPELRKTSGDISVCSFSIAVQRRFKKDEADFFDITVWRGQADNCAKYLKKGSKIGLVGSLGNNNYKKDDGSTVYRNTIIADQVDFLSSGGNTNQDKGGMAPSEVDQDDMPF